MPTVLVPIAPGFEEIETAAIVDVLRRGGVDVVLAGVVGAGPCVGSRGITFVPDAAFDAQDCDLVILPGGIKNAEALAADVRVRAMLKRRVEGGRPVAAICAAPLALDAAGVLPDRYTCYPGVEARLSKAGRLADAVVDAGLVVTSQGPGTAIAFAVHLVGRLCGDATRARVAAALL